MPATGPVDVLIIGFPGNQFNGDVAPAVLDLVNSGTIRVLDLLFVLKDAEGAVTTLQASDLDADGADFLSIEVGQPGALGSEDAEELSDSLEPNSSALAIAFENLWAGRFVEAVRESGGHVIDSVRIPVEVVDAVID